MRKYERVREYTIPLSAEYSVMSYAEDMWDAEEEAWQVLEKALQKSDADEWEIYETLSIHPMFSGYSVRLKVNYVICKENWDITDAYNAAVDLVEDISLPEGVSLVRTDQTDLIRVAG